VLIRRQRNYSTSASPSSAPRRPPGSASSPPCRRFNSMPTPGPAALAMGDQPRLAQPRGDRCGGVAHMSRRRSRPRRCRRV
jgi:hypothetical protein